MLFDKMIGYKIRGQGYMKMDRLDRIENDLDLLLKSIYELRDAQKQTDAQQKHTDEQILELRNAQKAGPYVLTQTSDGGAAILNTKRFRPKSF